MNELKKKDIWVYIEISDDGRAGKAGLELLSPGRELAGITGGKCTAVIVGYNTKKAAEEVVLYGPDRIIVVDNSKLEIYNTELYTDVMYRLVKKYNPDTVIFGATQNGRDFAPRLACRLKTGLTADCTGISFDSKIGKVIWTRPAFGGNLMAEIYCPETNPQMGTVRQGVFKLPDRVKEKKTEIVYEESLIIEYNNLKIIEFIKEEADNSEEFEKADIVVAGGRGTGGEKGFKLIKELAECMGASVGASRAAVEEGYCSRSRQIGQTGKIIAPKLYIACGISGAVQHMAGIQRAEVIVSINKDPYAPINKEADYSIVGDMFDIIPALINNIKSKKG